ncbi:hypothetical protein ABW19_dt0202197 [Dactylella cylindrospora]|nr:hypothetical protein ABW19_dt0202197 [Dactylella cylindrospora]
MPYNYSLISIVATWGLSLIPHLYAGALIDGSKLGIKYDNANPRNQWDNVKQKLPKELYGRVQRAQAASVNGMEVLGVWGVAVLAGNLAQLPVDTLNTYAAWWVGSSGAGLCCHLLWKSGDALSS